MPLINKPGTWFSVKKQKYANCQLLIKYLINNVKEGIVLIKDKRYKNNIERGIVVTKNTVAILFPYLRSQVTLMTAQPNIEPVVIPAININALLKNMES